MEREEIKRALEKLARGGKTKTKAVTYEYNGERKKKVKEVVTSKDFLPDKQALNKIMEMEGLGSLEDKDDIEV